MSGTKRPDAPTRDDSPPSEGLFFKFGRLHLGASGVPALATVAFIVLVFAFVFLIGRVWQAW
jgi:hypothetical protein